MSEQTIQEIYDKYLALLKEVEEADMGLEEAHRVFDETTQWHKINSLP